MLDRSGRGCQKPETRTISKDLGSMLYHCCIGLFNNRDHRRHLAPGREGHQHDTRQVGGKRVTLGCTGASVANLLRRRKDPRICGCLAYLPAASSRRNLAGDACTPMVAMAAWAESTSRSRLNGKVIDAIMVDDVGVSIRSVVVW